LIEDDRRERASFTAAEAGLLEGDPEVPPSEGVGSPPSSGHGGVESSVHAGGCAQE
jgi:hypothetical protein